MRRFDSAQTLFEDGNLRAQVPVLSYQKTCVKDLRGTIAVRIYRYLRAEAETEQRAEM